MVFNDCLNDLTFLNLNEFLREKNLGRRDFIKKNLLMFFQLDLFVLFFQVLVFSEIIFIPNF